MLAFLMLLIVILFIVIISATWMMYRKAGKGGWECIIPVYSFYVLTEIAGLNWWWFLLAVSDLFVNLLGIDRLSFIANLVSLFAGFNIYYNVAKKFKKENGTAVLAGIFSFVFILIFGYSKKEVYDKNIPVSKNGIFS